MTWRQAKLAKLEAQLEGIGYYLAHAADVDAIADDLDEDAKTVRAAAAWARGLGNDLKDAIRSERAAFAELEHEDAQ